MLAFFVRSHYMAALAIIGSLLGSLLMFLIGAYDILEAYLLFFGFGHPTIPGKELTEVTSIILSALDDFLLGFVLLYFAYNLFYLLTFPDQRENKRYAIRMPPGLQVETLGQMKKTILVIIVVSLSVFLLRENMISLDHYEWVDLYVPLSIIAIAVAIKLIKFDD
jgi:uncharacterized membrane protein YqhA